MYHLGIYREKVSLQPVECKSVHMRSLPFANLLADYSKLPESPPVDMIFILDPLIATGGTATAALHMIKDWGIPGMHHFLCVELIQQYYHVQRARSNCFASWLRRLGLKRCKNYSLTSRWRRSMHYRRCIFSCWVDMGRCHRSSLNGRWPHLARVG